MNRRYICLKRLKNNKIYQKVRNKETNPNQVVIATIQYNKTKDDQAVGTTTVHEGTKMNQLPQHGR